MLYLDEIQESIKRIHDKQIKICVVGVGTIGLPLATFLAKEGFQVVGLDISQKRVDEINSARVVYEYTDILEDVVLKQKKLQATVNPKDALHGVEAIFVCVPTPLNDKMEMDVKNLIDVANRITPYLVRGMTLIFESSVAIGTTKEISKTIENLSGLKFGIDLGLAYCPERYNPTPMKKIKQDLEYNVAAKGESFTVDKISRVVGGIDEKSAKIAKTIYSQFIKTDVAELTSIEAAEATKLLENIFRDVNIALVNELAKVYPKFGLDVFEIINAAKTKPFAFMPHYPGAGVGGECIPVDTWYLISQAEKLGIDTKLMKVAREINDSMPHHMIALLEEELREFNKDLSSARITILGLCYKKNVPDIRLSPTFTIIDQLKEKKTDIIICDPVYEKVGSLVKLTPLTEVFKDSDAILLVTDHDDFSSLDFNKIKVQMRTPILIDGRNFFNEEKLISLGFKYRAIGKP
jgi:nucleotide sugar dehydrogenase